ncbi:MAG: YraN family protein [Dehalococcoidia bacterium]
MTSPSDPEPRGTLGDLGRLGERLALEYLEAHGHTLVEANVRRREGEIDLVTLDGETLVFVEVKLRRSARLGGAIQALTPAKQRRMAALAEAYAANHPELPQSQRVDLVAIDLGPGGRVLNLQHVQSAVEG